MRCVDLYNQSQSKWFEEMVTISLVRNLGHCLHVGREGHVAGDLKVTLCPGAGTSGDGAGGDDQTAPVSVHNAPT